MEQRATREEGSLRVVSSTIGGTGAFVATAKGIVSAGGWLFVGALMGDLTNRVSLLLISYNVATAVFGVLGIVGAGFALMGTRFRAGALLMLIGAVGVAASAAAYPLLLPILMAPVVNATGTPVDYPGAGYYVVSFAPVLALLVGSLLAFFAYSWARNQ